MGDVVEMCSKEIGVYVKCVLLISYKFVEFYGLSEYDVLMIKCGVFFYDLGKVVIFDGILYKFGKFEFEEWD